MEHIDYFEEGATFIAGGMRPDLTRTHILDMFNELPIRTQVTLGLEILELLGGSFK